MFVNNTSDVDSINRALQRFGWLDYVFFVGMLLICAMIGVYFGFIKKVTSTQDYLAGGRRMLVVPISLSLIASYISGITLLGLPAEVYRFGMQYFYVTGGILVNGFAMHYIYLPVFLGLNITSTYEYLEHRFDRKMRLFGSVLYTIGNIAYLPIVIYVPALAFNQVTDVDIHIITPLVCFVCIFYTCVGGIQAVVWTDVIQTVAMFGSILLVIIKGTIDVGGVSTVIKRSVASGRLEAPILDIDPTVRHTFWAMIIGGATSWLPSNAVSQNMIQRYLALPNLRAAVRAAYILVFGVIVLITICSYCGLLIYATYYDCDPLTTQLARSKDQMLPLFVMDTLGELPGFSGLFVAGVFSAALSSLSTCLNSMSGIILEDFVKPFIKRPVTDKEAGYVMRAVVVVAGIICTSLVFLVEKAGTTVFQLTSSLESITAGPLLTVFSMGMLMPWVNAKGALIGGLSGTVFMTWLSLKAQAAIAAGHIHFEPKPLTTEGCTYGYNSTNNIVETSSESEVFVLFRISYTWYTLLGITITLIIGNIVSFLWKSSENKVLGPELFSPFLRKYISKKNERQEAETARHIKRTSRNKILETCFINNKKVNHL